MYRTYAHSGILMCIFGVVICRHPDGEVCDNCELLWRRHAEQALFCLCVIRIGVTWPGHVWGKEEQEELLASQVVRQVGQSSTHPF